MALLSIGIHACVLDMTQSKVCDLTRAYVWHESFIRSRANLLFLPSIGTVFAGVTSRIQMCNMTDSYVRHD